MTRAISRSCEDKGIIMNKVMQEERQRLAYGSCKARDAKECQ